MTDSNASHSGSNGPNPGASLFDLADGQGSDKTDAARTQELKRMLFDLTYLVMNADGREHISEQMLVRKLEHRMEREGSVDVEARSEVLAPLLEEGPEAIRSRVQELGDEVAEWAGDRSQAVGERYLDLLKGLIVADANVSAEEYELFTLLCDRWGVEKELPYA